MKQVLLLLALIFPCTSFGQKVPPYIKEHFSNCYTGKNSQIRDLLNIDGYYREAESGSWSFGYGKSRIDKDTMIVNMLFYEDGTFLYNFGAVGVEHSDDPHNILDYLAKAAADPEKYYFNEQGSWGIYRIEGNKLVLQYIHKKRSLNDSWYGWEMSYQIVNNHTIHRIVSETKPLFRMSNDEKRTFLASNEKKNFIAAQLIPCKTIPQQNSWLKKEDWTSCK